jgi:tetratricopeptide (TPR) repeat protein
MAMKPIKKLSGLDVTDSMKNNIEILNKAIGSVDVKKEGEAQEMLETIHGKVTEIEEYFWRPVDSPEIYESLMDIALNLGDSDKAEKYKSQIDLFKANELEFQGRVEDFFGNKVKAVEFFEGALGLVPDHELAKPAHEKALRRIEKARKDLDIIERKIQNNEDDPRMWFRYGTALLNMGDVQKAIHCYDRAIELNPSDSDAYARRGTAMESQGDFEGARKFFEQALTLKPTSMIAKRGMNYAEYFLGLEGK